MSKRLNGVLQRLGIVVPSVNRFVSSVRDRRRRTLCSPTMSTITRRSGLHGAGFPA